MLIHIVAAARPNFMKIAPLNHALTDEDWAEVVIVHTGQHYDLNMSGVFFRELEIPEPDLHLGVGSGTHAQQTAKVMIAYEKVLVDQRPELVIVVGDVNSTMGATLAASKIKYNLDNDRKTANNRHGRKPLVAHLEAGLRSFDRTMPEEVNRIVTDVLADIHWSPSRDADENLIREGVAPEKIHCVGNIMIDSLEMLRKEIETQSTYREFGLKSLKYGLITLHRPSNVDDAETLNNIFQKVARVAKRIPLVFPVHPRTRKNAEEWGLMSILEKARGLFLTDPLSYVQFMNLVFNSCLVLTDSGGIQAETSYLGIPCLTLRTNTEWRITTEQGTNQLCTLDNIENRIGEVLSGKFNRGSSIEFWDGKTANRVVESIKDVFTVQ